MIRNGYRGTVWQPRRDGAERAEICRGTGVVAEEWAYMTARWARVGGTELTGNVRRT